eukprot:351238-Chlamydomonas_euryale.AAC.1
MKPHGPPGLCAQAQALTTRLAHPPHAPPRQSSHSTPHTCPNLATSLLSPCVCAQAQALATKLAEAARESGILKRAVQIQSAKIERASADRDAALAHAQQLSEQLAGASDVARQLQAANYALSLQLQQATASAQFAGLCGRRPPDVF